MTAETTTISLDVIDAALAAAVPGLGEDDQRLAVAVLRLLAAGQPVSVPAAAEAAGLPGPRAEQAQRSWPAVFRDARGQVAGFAGLALAQMPHRLRHAGTDLSAWCAWDPQFLALVIGDLDVATADPVTCEAISNRVSSDGIITGASHPDPVLSFLRPGQPWNDDVMTTFCHYVLHFTSLGTAERWTTGPAARRRAAGRRGRRALLSPVRRDAANRPGGIRAARPDGKGLLRRGVAGGGLRPYPVDLPYGWKVKDGAMEIELPYFEGGPNWQLAGARLPEALHTARHAATPVTWPTAGDPDEAGRPGFQGSPILASGRYPFARPADRAGTACRLNSSDGAGDQSLTVRQIRAVLAYAG